MSHNKISIDWLKEQSHPVALVTVFTKSDANKYQSTRDMPPLTDEQWDHAVRLLEKNSNTDEDWDLLGWCLDYACKENEYEK